MNLLGYWYLRLRFGVACSNLWNVLIIRWLAQVVLRLQLFIILLRFVVERYRMASSIEPLHYDWLLIIELQACCCAYIL